MDVGGSSPGVDVRIRVGCAGRACVRKDHDNELRAECRARFAMILHAGHLNRCPSRAKAFELLRHGRRGGDSQLLMMPFYELHGFPPVLRQPRCFFVDGQTNVGHDFFMGVRFLSLMMNQALHAPLTGRIGRHLPATRGTTPKSNALDRGVKPWGPGGQHII